MEYPQWFYYPQQTRPPDWAQHFADTVAGAQAAIDSRTVDGLGSNDVLAALRRGLEGQGYKVEGGRRREQLIHRPVLFGEGGIPRLEYQVDAVHDEHGILVEIEAGRGARGNALYRDLVRSSLVVGARFLVLGMMIEYRHRSGGKTIKTRSYKEARDLLDAVYASGRLGLPFEGVLLVGY